MPHRSKPNALDLVNLKFLSLCMTLKLFAMALGPICLIVAGVMTLILSWIFHANAPVVFLGSVVGFTVLTLLSRPFQLIGRSHLVTVSQHHGFWDLADQLVFEDAQPALNDILEGRPPKEDSEAVSLALANAQVILTRKGEDTKALKLAEYLYEKERVSRPETCSYQGSALAAMYIVKGRYSEGIALLRSHLAGLDANDRTSSPAGTLAFLSLIHAYIDLHKFSEAKDYLSKLKDRIDGRDTAGGSDMDRMVHAMHPNQKIDEVFYFMYLGKLLMESGEGDPDVPLKTARDKMSDARLQKNVTLLYPEILLYLAFSELWRGDLAAAENFVVDSIKYYEQETRYRGTEYLKAIALRSYLKSKQNQGQENTADLEDILLRLRAELAPNHPYIALCLVFLGQCYVRQNNVEAAQKSFEEALQIRQALYPANDPQTTAVANLLSELPAANSGQDT